MFSDHKDLPLSQDPSTRLLPWIIGFMVYIATLALAGTLMLNHVAQSWTSGLSGALTVQITPDPEDEDDRSAADVTAAVRILLQTDGVASARPIPEDEIQALLEPWLGAGVAPDSLPLPRLIDVTLDRAIPLDLEALEARLALAVPSAMVDSHQSWRETVVALTRAFQGVALIVVSVVTIASIVMVVFATRGGLSAHRPVIDLLHLIGARDSYIARQFQTHALYTALKGGITGMVLAAATVIGLYAVSRTPGAPFAALGLFGPLEWLAILATPLVTGLIAMLTARQTVLRTLTRVV